MSKAKWSKKALPPFLLSPFHALGSSEKAPCGAFPLRPTGFEPVTCGLGNRAPSGVSDSIANTYDEGQGELGVLLGALAAEIAPAAPDLSAVLSAWAGLPEPIKAGIVAMVKAAAPADAKGD